MGQVRVLVVDPSTRNQLVLQESLVKQEFEVLSVSSGTEALRMIPDLQPDVILAEARFPDMSAEEFLQRLGAAPDRFDPTVLFLTKDPSPDERERWLRLGAKDVMNKPMYVSEIAARIRMVLARKEKVLAETKPATSQPEQTEEVPLVELIEQLAAERKTVVLHVRNLAGQRGEIGLQDGAVTYARLDGLQGEKAAYTMLGWEKPSVEVVDEESPAANISISTLGLVLEAVRWSERKRELEERLPARHGHYRLTSRYRRMPEDASLAPDVRRFLALLDGSRSLDEILAASPYDELTTLERLVKMVDRNVAEVVPGSEVETAPLPEAQPTQPQVIAEPESGEKISPTEAAKEAPVEPEIAETVPAGLPEESEPVEQPTARLEQAVERVEERKPKLLPEQLPEQWLLFVGSEKAGRRDLLEALSSTGLLSRSLSAARTRVEVELGVLSNQIGLLGLDTTDVVDPLLRKLVPHVLGAVLLVPANDRRRWEYVAYLYQVLREQITGPIVVAVTGVEPSNLASLRILKELLRMDRSDRLLLLEREPSEELRHALHEEFNATRT